MTQNKGTLSYIAPEILNMNDPNSWAKASEKVDIYSLGCLFYEIFELKTFNENDRTKNKQSYENTPMEMKDLIL